MYMGLRTISIEGGGRSEEEQMREKSVQWLRVGRTASLFRMYNVSGDDSTFVVN